MSGARSRRAGHKFERDVANHLTDRLDIEIVTARSLSGGTAIGPDLLTTDRQLPHGWAIECKTRRDGTHNVTPWCRQARKQSDGHPWAVVAKVPYKPVGDATVYTDCVGALDPRLGNPGRRSMCLDYFIDQLTATGG